MTDTTMKAGDPSPLEQQLVTIMRERDEAREQMRVARVGAAAAIRAIRSADNIGQLAEAIRAAVAVELGYNTDALDAALARVAELSAAEARAARLATALRNIQTMAEQGMKPDYKSWTTFHTAVADLARAALSTQAESVGLPTDEQCRAAIVAVGVGHIQGFRYGDENVIRDVSRPHGPEQEIWRGPVSGSDDFSERCELERMRVALAAAFRVVT